MNQYNSQGVESFGDSTKVDTRMEMYSKGILKLRQNERNKKLSRGEHNHISIEDNRYRPSMLIAASAKDSNEIQAQGF